MILQFPGAGLLRPWQYFWGWYVTGFDPANHCQKCLLGWRSEKVKNGMPVGPEIALDEHAPFDYFYLCGGDLSWRWAKNFHLAVRYREGIDTTARCSTGQEVIVRNAEYVEIQPVAEGFDGKGPSFTTCRNYQFGVGAYMVAADGSIRPPHSDGTYGVRPADAPRRSRNSQPSLFR